MVACSLCFLVALYRREFYRYRFYRYRYSSSKRVVSACAWGVVLSRVFGDPALASCEPFFYSGDFGNFNFPKV